MERIISDYDHLNNDPDYRDSQYEVRLPMDELALGVLRMNYGFQRFLSAARRAVRNPNNNFDYIREEVEAIVEAFENLPR